MTLALTPDTTIVALYGTKWVGVIPLMIPLALGMPFFGAHALLGPIICGLGRPDLEFWPQAISCGVAGVAYFFFAGFSATSVAWALFGVMVLRFLLISIFLFGLLQIKWRKALDLVLKRLLFSSLFGGAIWSVDWAMRLSSCSALVRFSAMLVISGALLGTMVWFAGDLVFGSDAVRFLLTYASHLPDALSKQFRKRVSMDPGAAGCAVESPLTP
jgi:O-antigen/teichoic acid export membrane protein